MFQPLHGHLQAISVHKNQFTVANIIYGVRFGVTKYMTLIFCKK